MSAAIPPVPPIPESPPTSKSFKTRRKSNSLTPKNENKSSASLNSSSQDMSASMTSEKGSSSSMLGKLRKMRKGKKSASSGTASLDGAASREDLAMAEETSRRNSLSNSEAGSQVAYDSESDTHESSGVLTSSTTTQQSIPTISTTAEDPTSTTPTRPGTSQSSLPDTFSPSPRKSATGIPNSRDPSPSKSGTSPGSSSANILGGIFGIGSGKKQKGGSADTNVAVVVPTITRSGTEVDGGKRPSTAPGIHLETPTPPTRSATATPTNKNWGSNTLPNTFVTPPTPIDPIPEAFRSTTPSAGDRRSRGNSLSNSSPKKLHSAAAFNDDRGKNPSHPLTPTIEVPTPQPTPNIGTNNSGFFSSMFNAAQNAATSLGNTIANTSLAPGQQGQGKGKKGEAGSISKGTNGIEANLLETNGQGSNADTAAATRKPLAVETLGQGELSLDHLGITSSADEGKDNGKNSKSKSRPGSVSSMSNKSGQVGLGLSTGDGDDALKGTNGSSVTAGDEPALPLLPKTPGYATPPQQYADDDSVDGRQRSNSVKSQARPGTGTGARRKRGSSAATSTPSLNNGQLGPGATPVTRPTGFAAVTTKRNRDFHNLFRSVPESDNLIEDYGCALQKEILLQGRMYVSERHICFNSNIFGWVTTLVISFDEVVAIEKKSTAVVFPNAIVIQTLHARNVFASFISRDSTYDLLVGIWRTTHPSLQTSANSVRLGDAKTSEFGSGSDAGSDDDGSSGSDGASYSSGSSEDHMAETVDALIISKPISKKPSSVNMATAAKPQVDGAPAEADAGASAGGGFPGPVTHAPTKCGDEASHFDKPLCDEVIPAPLGKVYASAFGDNSFNFMTRLLTEDEKVLELQIPDNGTFKDGTGDHAGKKTRSYQYVKPLNAPVGPKQTKCLITEVIEQSDFEKAITVVAHTQTPDVPSGGIFKVLTRYCLMWADGNATRLVMTCTIEWSGKSWLKGPIEKGASDGQTNFCKAFVAALRREFPATAGARKAGKAGKKKRRTDKDATASAAAASPAAAAAAKANEGGWGILSPFKAIFDPLTSLLGDIGGIVLGMLLLSGFAWLGIRVIGSWRGPPAPTGARGHYHPYPHNMALWNEMWIKEETALWEWLDDRSRVREILDGNLVSSEDSERVQRHRVREMERHLDRSENYYNWNDQRVEEAIRQTEEKLQSLKQVIQERKKKRKDARAKKDTPKEERFPEGAASMAEEKPVESGP